MVVAVTDKAPPTFKLPVVVSVAKDGLLVKVIWVEVPIKTCWPPVMDRLEEETVKSPKVEVPVPPLATESWPVQPKVRFWAEIEPVMLVSLVIPWTTLELSLAAAKVPVKPGTKVKVLAVEVLTLMVMLVSVVVAMWILGPVRAEMEVRAEVR